MQANARKAYTQLQKIGAPVFDTYSGGQPIESGHFAICGELAGSDDYLYPGSKNVAPDGNEWAEYYTMDHSESYSVFGVHNLIHDILEANDLYCEWYDCGSLRVYDA